MADRGWGWKLRRTAPAGTGEAGEATVGDDCEDCHPKRPVKQFSITAPLSPTIVDDDVLHPVAGTWSAVIDDQAVVLDLERPVPVVLNASAASIWFLIDGVRDVTAISADLAASTGHPTAELAADVRATATEFRRLGLVTRGRPSNPPRTTSPPDRWSSTILALLDQVAWATDIAPLAVGGTTARVRTNDAELGRELLRLLSDMKATGRRELTTLSVLVRDHGRGISLYVDGTKEWTQPTRLGLADRIVSDLNAVAAANPHGRAVLHAGAVEKGGRVVVVTGHSGRGKSTLVAALVQRGFRYLTDEAVAIGAEGLAVEPYAKPLSLTFEAANLLGIPCETMPTQAHKVLVPASELGSVASGGSVGLVVLLEDANDLPATGIDATSRVASLLALLATAFPATAQSLEALDVLVAMVKGGPVLSLPRLPLDEAVGRVEAALDDDVSRSAAPRSP